MSQPSSAPSSILDMLEELEAALASLRPSADRVKPRAGVGAVSPEALRGLMGRIGFSTLDLARTFGVDQEVVRLWLAGEQEIPAWVRASLLILGMLAPAARARVLSNPQQTKAPSMTRVHPFSRIEEL